MMRFERTFPAFPGHFDGDPLVPGAALLAWVQQEVAGLVAIEHARFTSPLRPGDPATLELKQDGDRVQFTVMGPAGPCVRGVGRVAARGDT